jgi:hypothetical protein
MTESDIIFIENERNTTWLCHGAPDYQNILSYIIRLTTVVIISDKQKEDIDGEERD